jgi:cytochrome c oxidase subunit 4
MIVPTKIYYRVAAALFVLFVMTVAAAYIDMGDWNIYIAMTIAVVKATLVVLYFMHVRYNTRVTWIFVCAGFFWLLILFTLTLADYTTRS